MTFDVFLKVSIVLISYDRHELNMLKHFVGPVFCVYDKNTPLTPLIVKPVRVFFNEGGGGTFHIKRSDYHKP